MFWMHWSFRLCIRRQWEKRFQNWSYFAFFHKWECSVCVIGSLSIENWTQSVGFFGYVEMMRELVDLQQLKDKFNLVIYLFPRNLRSKNRFLAVCYCLDKNVNLHHLKEFVPYGRLNGPGKNYMDRRLSYFKLFRMHAVFHDAFGLFMKSNLDWVPSYVYAVTEKPLFVKNMLLGHLSGLAYWLYLKLFQGTLCEQFAF